MVKDTPMANGEDDFKKAQAAKHYLDNVARFTVLYAKDLIALLSPQIASAKTILDVGCGPGTFGLAYLEAYPQGIPGQTLILSDLSPGMVNQAEQVMKDRIPPNFQTALEFKVEDGSKLGGIGDDSVDVVVSVFGIFIIPDYLETLQTIRRVLRSDNPNAVFGNVCWTMTEHRHELVEEGFGPSFHELIEQSLQELTSLSSSDKNEEPPWKRWFEPARGKEMLVADAGYDASSFQVHRCMHSVVWPKAGALWEMIATNPMSKMHQASPEKIESAKTKLFKALDREEGQNENLPVVVSTSANLFLAKPWRP
ncbi:ubiE/COQ5 methyltransferase family [Seminavis robusta]|uniref:UbiE/COQ5 methyltransferase family n=1 Tax=Seminavis robusta TaxID=568900 RepID=A0A9N8EL46_9STRA|nr:ubiE/COQ5 methyltransferase family [Seminavis robusta]|eukprot:Sro1455_g274120.1 ubiE/COQ5 methyltransferase family (310) ;mRNA; r:4990-5919